MAICYRDSIGNVIVYLNNTEIVFDGVHAYFTDNCGRDYKIEIKDIVSIASDEI